MNTTCSLPLEDIAHACLAVIPTFPLLKDPETERSGEMAKDMHVQQQNTRRAWIGVFFA